MAHATPVEAVIISGDRQGEIVRIPGTTVRRLRRNWKPKTPGTGQKRRADEPSAEELGALGGALGKLVTALERLDSQVKAATESLRKRAGGVFAASGFPGTARRGCLGESDNGLSASPLFPTPCCTSS